MEKTLMVLILAGIVEMVLNWFVGVTFCTEFQFTVLQILDNIFWN